MKLQKNDNIFVKYPFNLKSMMKKIYLFIASCAAIFQAYSQDPEFSQFYAAPVYTNPAMAGTAFCGRNSAGRMSLNYRNQWPSLPGTFRSFNASYDQHYDKIGGGIGLMATYDRAGAGLLTTTSLSGVYSYVLPVNKTFFLRAGLQASFVQKAIDHTKLRFGDQIHPTQGFVLPTQEPTANSSVIYPNFAAGFLAYSEKFYAGFAMHNITQPVQSFYSNNDGIVPRRYTFHTGVVIPLDNKRFSQATFSPNALFMMQQNFTQLNFGFYVNKGPIVTGLWYRQTLGTYGNSDALMVLLGFRKDRFKFGYSYDITVSSARAAAPGSHEVSATVDWCLRDRPLRFKPLRCPDF
ncbi:MAG: type IX secretion system membrane protein PorP/SprF [Bacteroidota bacterium]|nr:type IX secretion system membrane protein PorP/SprF [Bacteroidota bacterium]